MLYMISENDKKKLLSKFSYFFLHFLKTTKWDTVKYTFLSSKLFSLLVVNWSLKYYLFERPAVTQLSWLTFSTILEHRSLLVAAVISDTGSRMRILWLESPSSPSSGMWPPSRPSCGSVFGRGKSIMLGLSSTNST